MVREVDGVGARACTDAVARTSAGAVAFAFSLCEPPRADGHDRVRVEFELFYPDPTLPRQVVSFGSQGEWAARRVVLLEAEPDGTWVSTYTATQSRSRRRAPG